MRTTVAHEQIVGPVVTGLVGRAGHRARLLQHDFVSVEDPRDLDRDRLAAPRGPRNEGRLGDIGAIARLTPPSSWIRSAISSTSLFCSS